MRPTNAEIKIINDEIATVLANANNATVRELCHNSLQHLTYPELEQIFGYQVYVMNRIMELDKTITKDKARVRAIIVMARIWLRHRPTFAKSLAVEIAEINKLPISTGDSYSGKLLQCYDEIEQLKQCGRYTWREIAHKVCSRHRKLFKYHSEFNQNDERKYPFSLTLIKKIYFLNAGCDDIKKTVLPATPRIAPRYKKRKPSELTEVQMLNIKESMQKFCDDNNVTDISQILYFAFTHKKDSWIEYLKYEHADKLFIGNTSDNAENIRDVNDADE